MKVTRCLNDPRHYQIAVLTSLLGFGIAVLDFGIHWWNAITIVATALAVQLILTVHFCLPRFDPLSPLITSLSLTLLLRTDEIIVASAAAAIAIASKFLVRFRGKHVFNPANVALVTLMLTSDHAWVSSGQWGSAAVSAFALACLGFLVITRAKRAETTISFLLVYTGLVFCRASWLGDPIAIPLHQLQSGALLIFAFFMISDPKTTPNSPLGRVLFATIVATVAFTLQFVHYEPNGPVFALAACAPVVPLIDGVMRGSLYEWAHPSARKENYVKGAYR